MVDGFVPVLSDRYRARRELGRGGRATVWLADDSLLSRQVAVKVFNARAADPASLKQQETEAKVIASLNHHALTTLFDAGVDTTDPARPQIYLVMEYIPGSDLKRRLGSGPLEWFQLCWLGRDLSEGLQYLHGSGFLHRDIKPANILLATRDADVRLRGKLVDFGISSLIGRDDDDEYVTGTAAYLSPEQVEGDSPTEASDIYSLGLVLLEALTGQVAYPGGIEESAYSRLDRQPVIPHTVPAPIADVLSRMVALDPAQRPPLTETASVFQNLLIDDLVRQRGYAVRSVTGNDRGASQDTEAARQAALERYDILDTGPDETYDTITRLAAHIFATPMAIIALTDRDRVWFKSALGWDQTQVARDAAFCTTTTPGTGTTWTIPDALLDPRTRTNPHVTDAPAIRAYAGAPLITHDGHEIGALCVLDREPRTFTPAQLTALTDLASLVMHELEIRLATKRILFPTNPST